MNNSELLHVEFALVPSSGMDGFVLHECERDVSPAEGLTLVLLDRAGTVVASARVEWDGAFVFENVRPGVYRLTADVDALSERKLVLRPEAMELTFPPGADPAWLSGIELQVRQAGGAP